VRIQSYPAAWALPALLAASGCDEGTTTPELPQPAAITIVSGNEQYQGRGRELHDPIVVRAEDDTAQPMAGVMLEFTPDPPTGIVDPVRFLTDSVGQVTFNWTLGDVVGTQTVSVAAAGGHVHTVVAATARAGDFDIHVVADTVFNAEQLAAIRAAVERWAAVITNDLPDQRFEEGFIPVYHCEGYEQLEIAPGGLVDDVVLGVTTAGDPGSWGFGHCYSRPAPDRKPMLVYLRIGPDVLDGLFNAGFEGYVAHIVGHLLGFGWRWRDQLRNPARTLGFGADTHFPDPATIAAFDAAGGSAWTGSKVPVANLGPEHSVDTHWRRSVLGTELMSPPFTDDFELKDLDALPLSAITVQSMAALGYEVDVSMADPYAVSVPATTAGETGPVVQPVAVRVFHHDGWIAEVVHKMTPYPKNPR